MAVCARGSVLVFYAVFTVFSTLGGNLKRIWVGPFFRVGRG